MNIDQPKARLNTGYLYALTLLSNWMWWKVNITFPRKYRCITSIMR